MKLRPLTHLQQESLAWINNDIVESGLAERYGSAIEKLIDLGGKIADDGIFTGRQFDVDRGESYIESSRWAQASNGLFAFAVNSDLRCEGRLIEIEMLKIEPGSSTVVDGSEFSLGRVGFIDPSEAHPQDPFIADDLKFAYHRLPLLAFNNIQLGNHMPWLVYGDPAADMTSYASNLASWLKGSSS